MRAGPRPRPSVPPAQTAGVHHAGRHPGRRAREAGAARRQSAARCCRQLAASGSGAGRARRAAAPARARGAARCLDRWLEHETCRRHCKKRGQVRHDGSAAAGEGWQARRRTRAAATLAAGLSRRHLLAGQAAAPPPAVPSRVEDPVVDRQVAAQPPGPGPRRRGRSGSGPHAGGKGAGGGSMALRGRPEGGGPRWQPAASRQQQGGGGRSAAAARDNVAVSALLTLVWPPDGERGPSRPILSGAAPGALTASPAKLSSSETLAFLASPRLLLPGGPGHHPTLPSPPHLPHQLPPSLDLTNQSKPYFVLYIFKASSSLARILASKFL